MTFKHALRVLMEATGRDFAGAGVGIRQVASAKQKAEVIEAVRKVYPKVYGFEPSDTDLANLGIHQFQG